MGRIVVHDTRLEGNTPSFGDIPAIRVDGRTSLSDFSASLARQIDDSIHFLGGAWMNTMYIFCHGSSSGLVFCEEMINNQSLWLLRPLRNKVGTVIIHGCQATTVNPMGQEIGPLHCGRLARLLNASVIGSDAIQSYRSGTDFYDTSNDINFESWEGDVYTWNAYGRIVNVARDNS
jgi:hypothetical protein